MGLCALIASGLPTSRACAALRLSPSTVRHWRAQAHPEHRRHHERYVDFAEALELAEIERIRTLVSAIMKAALPHEVIKRIERQVLHPRRGVVTLTEVTTTIEWDWRAGIYLLERFDPATFGRR